MAEQKLISIEELRRLLGSKQRQIVFTRHAREQSEKRLIPKQVLAKDLFESPPLVVLEQPSENPIERKFNVYYRQLQDFFHRYVIVLNNELRVITLMRTNREYQEKIAGD